MSTCPCPGMSLANFVSWRDSLLCQVHYQPPPALEKGSLVKVMHSGLLLYGVVKEVKTDGHTAVEMVCQNTTCTPIALSVSVHHTELGS